MLKMTSDQKQQLDSIVKLVIPCIMIPGHRHISPQRCGHMDPLCASEGRSRCNSTYNGHSEYVSENPAKLVGIKPPLHTYTHKHTIEVQAYNKIFNECYVCSETSDIIFDACNALPSICPQSLCVILCYAIALGTSAFLLNSSLLIPQMKQTFFLSLSMSS